ncbi:MAG TPA: DCC1-like thiol-disulfide oxidoreductase family protein [Candidatus Limnocylindria bacterium]|nr:DCC1-like thiol-disulfide oxidoreductase family protein [Candidatus Limnocylindria bacterium]
MTTHRPVPDRSGTLLYDGDCGLCVATAGWLRDRAPAEFLGLLALQQVDSDPGIAAHVAGRDLAESVTFVRADGRVLTGARAALAAGRLVRGWGLFAILADHRPGHAFLEPLYREIALHRRRIGRMLGLPAVCPLVTRPRAERTDRDAT